MRDFTKPKRNEDKYRPGVGMMIMNPKFEILCGLKPAERGDRSMLQNYWQLPQGGIEDSETPEQAVRRECREELGIIWGIDLVNSIPKYYFYELPGMCIPQSFKKKGFIGHKHYWFLIHIPGENYCVNINTPEPEFVDWRWSTIAEVVRDAKPYKKELYKSVWNHFGSIWDYFGEGIPQ